MLNKDNSFIIVIQNHYINFKYIINPKIQYTYIKIHITIKILGNSVM